MLGIALMLRVNRRVIMKPNKVVLVLILQRGTTFILSALAVKQEESPNVVIGMLQVFYIDVYALLYPGATL